MTEQKTKAQNFNETVESLTGIEEDRIEAQFGNDIYGLINNNRVTKASRALVFTMKVREGLESPTADQSKVIAAAKRDVQAMTIKEIDAFFADDELAEPDVAELESSDSE